MSATSAASSTNDDSSDNNSKVNESNENKKKMPTAVFLIGMAGTGKTSCVHRINHYVVGSSGGDADDEDENDEGEKLPKESSSSSQKNNNNKNKRSYFINLDPAVIDVPFAASIDIRDTITQKEVMAKFRLGPNGAIMTALNMFATKINEVLSLIEKRSDELDYVFIDTPGQIEVFTWSASGQMILEAFAATMPTVMLFVADTVRCANPQTFMSTMLYSCSVLYKSQLPLCIVFNKCDVTDGSRVTEWLEDVESFSAALKQQKSFAATLSDSLSLFMNEYYRNIAHVSVSAVEGTGIDELFEAIDIGREKFERDYLPLIAKRQKQQEKAKQQRARLDAQLFETDLGGDSSSSATSATSATAASASAVSASVVSNEDAIPK